MNIYQHLFFIFTFVPCFYFGMYKGFKAIDNGEDVSTLFMAVLIVIGLYSLVWYCVLNLHYLFTFYTWLGTL